MNFRSPKLLALGLPALLMQCAPQQCAPAPAPAAETVTVARVVDGDTIKLTSGDTVRFIGIDTPEEGQCGYIEASNLMRSLVDHRPVTLTTGARTDRDRYDRILRYVDVSGTDVGLAMVDSGWAHSRYDSRDGYGAHPREAAYVAADAVHDAPACGW
jgi:micrococcal nuclease